MILINAGMAFNKDTQKYLNDHNYQDWTLLGHLQDLTSKVTFTSTNEKEINETFLLHLQAKAGNSNIPISAKNKAQKLMKTLESTWKRLEIRYFMDKQDLKASQVSYINLSFFYL